ncbi:uncharacterized protein LOC131053482 isoform X2 [Cryptomeria japonica]|uniref:uncharacterized protein LOC131053482 isoform X2 n=1 Tax=Cryptomeria japonica TaxID=3369 RepID=UPI0025ACA352|nr:uncharacterized protein LOC131053482 isoform X2 [Cryptomeria japonica]
MDFKKVERSYYSTPNGYRLATFDEVKNGLPMIKEQNILNKWDRVRLLDGWITGPGYNFEMGNDFKGCLGYMLLIQIKESGGTYANVHLTERGKEVALFLCVDDWNYEVVYWLLNSWSNSETMNIGEVIEGNILLGDVNFFEEKNKIMGHVARRLGEEGGAALQKAGKTKYSGKDSVKEVLSGMIKIVTEYYATMEVMGCGIWRMFALFEAEEFCLPDSVRKGDVAEPFWSFVCDSFAGYVVEVFALTSLLEISKMKIKSPCPKDLMTATSILLYLSDFRSDIIHEPLAHHCQDNCAGKILRHAAEKAVGVPQTFNSMLRHNPMWRCYDATGNYGVLSKLLFIVAKGEYTHIEQVKNMAGTVVEMLLQCGAQPGRRYAIGKYKAKTALHLVTKIRDKDVGTKITQALLDRCDEQSISELVNAADDRGRSALHSASEKGGAHICGLLVGGGASVTAQDKKGMTALHYAFEGEFDEVIDVLLESPRVSESLDLKDNRGYTPLDIAVEKKKYESIAELLSKSEESKTYFNKVDPAQFLCTSLQLGYVRIADRLFKNGVRLPYGDRDQEGKTALHLAAMCDNESNAMEIISLLIERATPDSENMVAKRDNRGRTALHEAALNGHAELCQGLLELNPELIYIKDRDGRNPLYDVVKGEYKDRKSIYPAYNENYKLSLSMKLLDAYLEKDVSGDDLMDSSGRTLLHIAASQGKAEFVEELLSRDKIKTKLLSRADIRAQTPLHMAVKRGEKDIVKILLDHGAHPLRERDCDGRTALHYAVQAKAEDKRELAPEHKKELALDLLEACKSDEEKSLLLWASAAGFGTADQYPSKENDPLHKFLVDEKNKLKEDESLNRKYKGNLLKMAASLGQIDMTKELISRGYQIGDIRDPEWTPENQEEVKKVLRQIETIKEQGNDKPAITDALGRFDYAQGLAALFLNPYIKPPIAVGITGSWGMGKSSLMLQTQRILLTTAAQMALFQSSKLSSSELELPDIKPCELSTKAKRKCKHIYRQIKCEERVNKNRFLVLWDNIRWKLKHISVEEVKKELDKILNEYDLKYLKVIKALAAMNSSDMLKTNASRPKADPPAEENVPAVLTVQYNAWKYKDDTEALAGIAVEITKELEGIMTQDQWLSTCWRNTWEKKKYSLWIEIFFPSLLALVLVSSFTWILWVVLDGDKLKGWVKAKYAWPPAAVVIIVWTLTKSIMGVLKPVSTQLMQYISFPDHADKLGYQEQVIPDISFLKDEIGKTASWVFVVLSWVFAVFSWVFTIIKVICGLITGWYIISLPFHHRSHEKVIEAPKLTPASGSNLRIIVFVDDLDRCQESVILKVLSAVNLVLAECNINVVIGMDKRLIERAIIKKFEDANAKDNQELADMYLQKIIQVPVDLPDPSDEESSRFLKGQLGVSENENKTSIEDNGSSTNGDEEREDVPDNRSSTTSAEEQEAVEQNSEAQDHTAISVQSPSETADMRYATGQEKPTSYTLVREMLFVRYSRGEENAFLYFQRLATDCRKHPREWKRLLNYHRLVWYIFSVNEKAKNFYGWQVELITWIFMCWEWQEFMNLVIKKWKEIGDLKMNAPSLLMIVEHLMEERERENMKVTSHDENGKGKIVKTKKPEDISKSTDDFQNSEKANAERIMEQKLDALEKSLVELKKEMKRLKEVISDELKKEMKQLKEVISDELKKDLKEFKEQVSDEFEKIKEQMVGKKRGKSEESWETEKKNWERMKSALEKYDVSMDGVESFQRFRFYCIAGYLPPFGEDSKNGSS